MTDAQNTEAKATIVMTARDRFSLAVRALNEIARVTAKPYQLIYIDGGSPKVVADEIRATCEQHGFRYMRYDTFLSPCQARNIGHRCGREPVPKACTGRGWAVCILCILLMICGHSTVGPNDLRP